MTPVPATLPYPAAVIHYVGSLMLADTTRCTAAIVTAVHDGDKHPVTATLFMAAGVPAAGAYAVYDGNPDHGARAAGSWHWPADDAPAAAVSA
jgi:hypothetical protein